MPLHFAEPAPIERIDSSGPWAKYQIDDPRRILSAARDLCRGGVALTLGVAMGGWTVVSLWAVDDLRGRVYFRVDDLYGRGDALALLQLPGLSVACHLGEEKLQFELHNVTLESAVGLPCLSAALPDLMYRSPRRRALRVRRGDREIGRLSVDLSALPGAPASSLGILDVGVGGCAFALPASREPDWPGGRCANVGVLLADEELFRTDIIVRHVTRDRRDQSIDRVGTQWLNLPQAGLTRLHSWMRRGQGRRELWSLTFDFK